MEKKQCGNLILLSCNAFGAPCRARLVLVICYRLSQKGAKQGGVRNTTDKGTTADPLRVYPDKLQSGYRMAGEEVSTKHRGDANEIADDS